MSYLGLDQNNKPVLCPHPEFTLINKNIRDVKGKLIPKIFTVCRDCFEIAAMEDVDNFGQSKALDPVKVQATLDDLKNKLGTFKQTNASLKSRLKFANDQIKDLKDQLARCNNGVA